MSTRVYGSLARIADFRNSNFEVRPLPRDTWATGDYVEGEVVGTPTPLYRMEDRVGHMVKVEPETFAPTASWMPRRFGSENQSEPSRLRICAEMRALLPAMPCSSIVVPSIFTDV